jgi:hypothetical protein
LVAPSLTGKSDEIVISPFEAGVYLNQIAFIAVPASLVVPPRQGFEYVPVIAGQVLVPFEVMFVALAQVVCAKTLTPEINRIHESNSFFIILF